MVVYRPVVERTDTETVFIVDPAVETTLTSNNYGHDHEQPVRHLPGRGRDQFFQAAIDAQSNNCGVEAPIGHQHVCVLVDLFDLGGQSIEESLDVPSTLHVDLDQARYSAVSDGHYQRRVPDVEGPRPDRRVMGPDTSSARTPSEPTSATASPRTRTAAAGSPYSTSKASASSQRVQTSPRLLRLSRQQLHHRPVPVEVEARAAEAAAPVGVEAQAEAAPVQEAAAKHAAATGTAATRPRRYSVRPT